MSICDEPIMHSHLTDVLDDKHPKAFTVIDCGHCGDMVHCSNNECMQTWFEYDVFALCGDCFARMLLQSEGVFRGQDFEVLAKMHRATEAVTAAQGEKRG